MPSPFRSSHLKTSRTKAGVSGTAWKASQQGPGLPGDWGHGRGDGPDSPAGGQDPPTPTPVPCSVWVRTCLCQGQGPGTSVQKGKGGQGRTPENEVTVSFICSDRSAGPPHSLSSMLADRKVRVALNTNN